MGEEGEEGEEEVVVRSHWKRRVSRASKACFDGEKVGLLLLLLLVVVVVEEERREGGEHSREMVMRKRGRREKGKPPSLLPKQFLK